MFPAIMDRHKESYETYIANLGVRLTSLQTCMGTILEVRKSWGKAKSIHQYGLSVLCSKPGRLRIHFHVLTITGSSIHWNLKNISVLASASASGYSGDLGAFMVGG